MLNAAIRARENPNSGREPIAAPQEIARFAKQALNDMQGRSFASGKELCGLLLEDETGSLSVSTISEGREADCDLPWVLPRGKFAVATFHTHGTFSEEYDSEVPSVQDLQADIDEQIDGFVATPGGRIWYTDWETKVASQACGEKCIAQDPAYRPDRQNPPAPRYTLRELEERQGNWE
ncbi:DUF4329 domain-containing protein [Qipengyuania sp. CAU 1752]